MFNSKKIFSVVNNILILKTDKKYLNSKQYFPC